MHMYTKAYTKYIYIYVKIRSLRSAISQLKH